jgi:hypothetical protein
MSFFKGKQRQWADIAADPQVPYMVGRLLGANEMAVALLRLEENETAKQVANALEKVSGFFLEDSPTKQQALPSASEADTWHT